MEETAVISLTWLFILLKPLLCAISCAIKINLHTLVILSFTEEFRTIFRLRQKELEKKTEQTSKTEQWIWIIFVKRRWRFKKLCLFRFQNMWPHQSYSPAKTRGRQRHEIFWRQRLCWLVKYVNTNLPWSQFLTLVVKELFFGHNLFFFSVFRDVFVGAEAVVIALTDLSCFLGRIQS